MVILHSWTTATSRESGILWVPFSQASRAVVHSPPVQCTNVQGASGLTHRPSRTTATCTQVAMASQHLQTGASCVNMLSTYRSCKGLPVFMEAETAAAATAVYILSSQGLAPAHIVDSPLSQTAPKFNTFNEPACNPCHKLLIRKAQCVCSSPSSSPCYHSLFALTSPPLQIRIPGSFCCITHFPPSHYPSVIPNPPPMRQPPAADLPLAATRVTIAATSSSSLPGMVSSGRPARAPLSHGCFYRGGHSLISRALGKAVFCSC